MFVVGGTSTRLVHHFSQPTVGGNDTPSLLHQGSFLTLEPHTTTLGDPTVQPHVEPKFLKDVQPPGFTTFRKLHRSMDPFLHTNLHNLYRVLVDLTSNRTFCLEFLDLGWGPLIDSLEGRVRSTRRGDPNMLGPEGANLLYHQLQPFLSRKVMPTPQRTPTCRLTTACLLLEGATQQAIGFTCNLHELQAS